MKNLLICLTCILLLTSEAVYAAASPPFYSGEFQVWEPEQFPCSLQEENPMVARIFQEMQITKRRSVEVEQRNIFFKEQKMTCDSFIHAGILYVPVRQTAEFLGKKVEYFPDEKIILLEYQDNTAQEIFEPLKSTEKKRSAMKEITVDNIPIYYHSRDTELDAFKTRNTIDFAFSTFRCEGKLFMPLKTLAEAEGCVRIYKGTDVYLYDKNDFPQVDSVNTNFTVTGIDTNANPDIDDETVRKIAIKIASEFSEPGNVTYMATQNILYFGRPAVLLVIGWETDYKYSQIPSAELFATYVYVLKE